MSNFSASTVKWKTASASLLNRDSSTSGPRCHYSDGAPPVAGVELENVLALDSDSSSDDPADFSTGDEAELARITKAVELLRFLKAKSILFPMLARCGGRR